MKTKANIEKWLESPGVKLEFWYIERALSAERPSVDWGKTDYFYQHNIIYQYVGKILGFNISSEWIWSVLSHPWVKRLLNSLFQAGADKTFVIGTREFHLKQTVDCQ